MSDSFFLPLIKDGDYSYYVLDKNQVIYRGDTEKYIEVELNDNVLVLKKHQYFTNVPQEAEKYGILAEYKTTKQLKLLAMDDANNIRQLARSDRGAELMDLIERVFGDYMEGLVRDSIGEIDNEISRILCEMGFDGYATNKMPTRDGDMFHEEILICDPMEKVEFGSFIVDDEDIERKLDNYKMKKLDQEDKQQRMKKRQKHRFFQDDDVQMDIPIKGKLMF